MIAQLADALMILTVVVSLFMLGTSAMKAIIRATALQGLLLAFLPVLVRGHLEVHAVAIGLATIGLKVIAIPRLLTTAMQRAGVNREVEPLIGHGASVFLGGVLVAVSFALGQRLVLPGEAHHSLLVPCAFSTLLVGLLILVSRSKAITQVAGYVVLENGIFIFGLALVRELPFIVELGVFLDVLVGVFLMGLVVHRISAAFDHIDTHALTALKD